MLHVYDQYLGVGVRLAGYVVPLCVLREPQLGAALELFFFLSFPHVSRLFFLTVS